MTKYDAAVLFKLVRETYTTDHQLNNLCFNRFRPVFDEFTTGMTRSQKIRMLVGYAERQGLFERLLGAIKQHDPAKYDQYISGIHFSTRDHYLAQIAQRHATLEFVGIPELKDRQAMQIDEVFVHLRAETEDPLESVDDTGWLTLTKRPQRRIKRRLSVNDALHLHNWIVILGDPGAGKTTLLKYIAHAFAIGRGDRIGLDEECLPIFIRLYDYVAKRQERLEDYSLVDYLYTQARENLLLTLEPSFFESELTQGNCFICLDGLDELGNIGLRRDINKDVAALASRYSDKNRFVITSRIVGYNEAPLSERYFAHYTVLPFTDDDIRQFVRKWYQAREVDPVRAEQQAHHLIETILTEPRIKTLATNPLLLTIIALVHRIEAELPHERVKLYEKCVTALIETWETVKRLTIVNRERPFYENRYELLEQLAFWLHIQPGGNGRPREIAEGDLTVQLSQYLMQNPRLQLDRRAAWSEAEAFINLMKARTGLLVERGEGVYMFAHLTIQEYLAAAYIMHEHAHSIDEIWGVIEPHLYDAHWRQVILLLLGSLNKFRKHPTELVRRIVFSQDSYETVLHRHLYLAAQALADHVRVDARLQNHIIDKLLHIVRQDELGLDDALENLARLQGNERILTGLLAIARDEGIDGRIRAQTAITLGKLGQQGEAATLMLKLAQDDELDDWVRRTAVIGLGQLGVANQTILSGLLDLARDWEVAARVQIAAAAALGELGHAEGVLPSLLALVHDPAVDDLVRDNAAMALEEIAHRDEEALPGLLAVAQNQELGDWIRRAAAEALGELGQIEAAVQVLSDMAHDKKMDVWVRRAAADSLGRLGRVQEAVAVLLVLAQDEAMHNRVRQAAAISLAECGHKQEAIDVLLQIAQETAVQPMDRHAAAESLGKLGQVIAAADILQALARDDQMPPRVRRAAVNTLGELALSSELILATLLSLAEDGAIVPWLRRNAATVLGQYGRTNEAARILLTLAQDESVDAHVRINAAIARGRLGRADATIGILHKLAQDESLPPQWRRLAAESLGEFGGADEKMWPRLLALVRDPEPDVQFAAVAAIGQLGSVDEALLAELITLARDGQMPPNVRFATAESLVELGQTVEAAELLLALMADDNVSVKVRRQAVKAVGNSGYANDKILSTLLNLSQNETLPYALRRAAYDSLKASLGVKIEG